MSLQDKLKRTLELTRQKIEAQNDSEKSNFFPTIPTIPNQFVSIIVQMNAKLNELNFGPPVACVYNPTEYAFDPYFKYLNQYCATTKEIMFLGMNPGPFGMCQTGVPFGEVAVTKDWLGIHGVVNKPPRELDIRPITGFECHRSEVSGKRFWGLIKEICGVPEIFFKNAFVHNYCPFAFMKLDGKNITPTEIKGSTAKQLIQICDQALYEVINLLQIKIVVGVGRYAETRATSLIKDRNLNIQVLYLPHPSPRVVGSEHWHENSLQTFQQLDLLKYFNGY